MSVLPQKGLGHEPSVYICTGAVHTEALIFFIFLRVDCVCSFLRDGTCPRYHSCPPCTTNFTISKPKADFQNFAFRSCLDFFSSLLLASTLVDISLFCTFGLSWSLFRLYSIHPTDLFIFIFHLLVIWRHFQHLQIEVLNRKVEKE